MHAVSINAQGSGGDDTGIRALLSMVAEVDRDWALVFISESDFFAKEDVHIDVSPHLTWRHYPGEGSRAMRFVLRDKYVHLFQSIDWQGRCGLLSVSSGRRDCQVSASFLGVHGAHGDQLEDTLADASSLLGVRSSCCKTLFFGDTNVDFLPQMSWDPWRVVPDRLEHHSRRRQLFQMFVDSLGFDLVFPSSSVGAPVGKWSNSCVNLCISRVPGDDQLGLPALLDFGAARRNFVSECWQSWMPQFSDHAATVFVLRFSCSRPRFCKTTWRCSDVIACESWLRSQVQLMPSNLLPPVFDACAGMNTLFADKTSCAARRKARMPFQLRSLYARIHACTYSPQCAVLRKQAFSMRRQWINNVRQERIRNAVCKGSTLFKSKKLHRVSSVDNCFAQHDICDSVAASFSQRWGGNQLQTWEHIRDFVHAAEGRKLDISEDMVDLAFLRLKKPLKLDRQGICVQMLRHIFNSVPKLFVNWISCCLSSTSCMESLLAFCNVYGKKSSHSTLHDLRAIVPMSSILRLFDRILHMLTEHLVDSLLPVRPGIFVGARRYTQTLDVGHSVSLVMEKCLDDYSRGSVAQADIKTYFDCLPLLRIVRWLLCRGVDHALLAAILRAQLFTQVVVCIGSVQVPIIRRTRGGLTGSLMALLLARIPVESTMLECADSLLCFGLDVGHTKLLATSYVDNLFTVSSGTSGATAAMELLLCHLADVWDLKCKPDSKKVISCKNCPDMEVVGNEWELCDSCEVLGFLVQNNAGLDVAWAELKAKLWRAFFGNVRSPGFRKLSTSHRCKVIDTALQGLFLYHAQPWPPQAKIAVQVDSVQKRMMGLVARVPKLDGDDAATYLQRRSRIAKRIIEDGNMWWTQRWFKRAGNWDSHLRRDLRQQLLHLHDGVSLDLVATRFSWAPLLLDWKGKDFLDVQRSFEFRDKAHVLWRSRTKTRACLGRPQVRWHEGIVHARSFEFLFDV